MTPLFRTIFAGAGFFFAGGDFFFAAEDLFFRAVAAAALRAARFTFAFTGRVFGREALLPFFRLLAGVFVLPVFTPSRECRMIVFRLLAALRAGLRVVFFMVVSPSPGS
ncbi:MAG: hypothetical protein M3S32_02915 [Acidobacteriota bacterium]|nr:hypothetical protein [Acidobacteriota bacterium]